MDKNLPQDPLEEFFRKSLEETDNLPADDGWDLPSLNVWDNVEASIPPTAVIRPINYWKWTAIAASVVILFVGYQWINKNQQVEQLTTELEKNTKELENVKELLNEKIIDTETAPENNLANAQDNNKSERFNTELSEQQEVVQDESIERRESTTSFSGNNANGIGGKNNDGIPQIPSTNSQNIAIENNAQESILLNETKRQNKEIVEEVGAEIKKENLLLDQLSNRNFLVQSEEKTSKEKLDLETKTVVNLKRPRESKLYVGIYGSQNKGKQMTTSSGGSTSMDRRNRIRNSRLENIWTTGGGFRVGYEISNRWSIESGLQYTCSEMYGRHLISKKYTSTGELPNSNGDYENDYALSIVTVFGDVGSDVTISREASMNIPENTPFILQIDSRQKISFLGIPILAKYNLGKIDSKFNVGLKFGTMANFVKEADVEFEAESISPFIEHRKHLIKDKKDLRNAELATLDFMTGVEAEYKVSEKVSFSIEPSLSKSLTPVYEKQGLKTYPMMANVKVGFNYRF